MLANQRQVIAFYSSQVKKYREMQNAQEGRQKHAEMSGKVKKILPPRVCIS